MYYFFRFYLTKLDTIKPTINIYGPSIELYSDPKFKSGLNNIVVYNLLNNNNVTITRQLMETNYGNSYALKLNTVGDAYPGSGGFFQITQPELNKYYIHIFVAKVPKGLTLLATSNYLGEGSERKWLSNNVGTGDWYQYVYITKTGSTLDNKHSSLGTFGHVYISDSIYPITWYLSYSQLYKVDANSSGVYWLSFSDNIEISLYQITTSFNQPTSWKTLNSINGYYTTYSPTASGTYYIWLKDVSGNISYSSFIVK